MNNFISFLLLSIILFSSCTGKPKENQPVEISVHTIEGVKDIFIDAEEAQPLHLSEIAEKVTSITLQGNPRGIQYVLMTKNYLFFATARTVLQYDLSGRFIRRIDIGGWVTGYLAADADEKTLFVPVGNKIKSFDFLGNLKTEYSLQDNNFSLACLYHNGTLWILSGAFQEDRSIVYSISRIKLSTNEKTVLPFEKIDEPFFNSAGSLINTSAHCLFTLHNGEIIVSLASANFLYRIRQDEVTPLVQWDITPASTAIAERRPRASGFSGHYLFINYRRGQNFFIFLKNLYTGQQYNANDVVDDIFHTGANTTLRPLSGREGYFYFFRDVGELFIVRLK